jgi:hypothetical protein
MDAEADEWRRRIVAGNPEGCNQIGSSFVYPVSVH